jgi:hypothetical protein
MRAHWLVGLLVVPALGCGPPAKFAPVSGVVTMNGKPLVGATVSFLPEPIKGSTEAPVTSSGKTNDKGEYTLQTGSGQDGALVGKHKVTISLPATEVVEGDRRLPRGGPRLADKIPPRYNTNSELTCEVPEGGKTDANYDLKSR